MPQTSDPAVVGRRIYDRTPITAGNRAYPPPPSPPLVKFLLSFTHFFKFFGFYRAPQEILIPSVGGVKIFSGPPHCWEYALWLSSFPSIALRVPTVHSRSNLIGVKYKHLSLTDSLTHPSTHNILDAPTKRYFLQKNNSTNSNLARQPAPYLLAPMKQ